MLGVKIRHFTLNNFILGKPVPRSVNEVYHSGRTVVSPRGSQSRPHWVAFTGAALPGARPPFGVRSDDYRAPRCSSDTVPSASLMAFARALVEHFAFHQLASMEFLLPPLASGWASPPLVPAFPLLCASLQRSGFICWSLHGGAPLRVLVLPWRWLMCLCIRR